jgi:hypothetical protein
VVEAAGVEPASERARREKNYVRFRFGSCRPILDIAQILKDRMGAAARRVPTRQLPNWLVRIAGLDAAFERGEHRRYRRKPGAARALEGQPPQGWLRTKNVPLEEETGVIEP